MTYMAKPILQEPQGVMKFTILIDPSLLIITLHLVCLILYGHALAQEPLQRGREIYKFGKPFPGHHNYVLILTVLCSGE